ncbi:7702_t:CDS:2, partial [Entrophospora sp. SA101]
MSHNSIILNKSTAPKPLIPFTILPSPFQTVIVISATQYQQAIQKINVLDNEIRNAGVNLTHIQDVSKKQKASYSNIIAELIPLYAKINRLIPLYYIVTKNNDIAARNIITMKYLIQKQFIALPDEQYFLRIGELQRHKELLYQLEKYEYAIEKLQNSGGSGAGALAKFLSLVKDEGEDSFGQLSKKRVHLENIAKFQRYTKDLVKEKERYLANTQEALDTEMKWLKQRKWELYLAAKLLSSLLKRKINLSSQGMKLEPNFS